VHLWSLEKNQFHNDSLVKYYLHHREVEPFQKDEIFSPEGLLVSLVSVDIKMIVTLD
jgi:hypothetical protein